MPLENSIAPKMQSQYLAHSEAAQGIPTYFKLLLNCFSPELFANVHPFGGERKKMGFLYLLVSYTHVFSAWST
jgi:hypothetical protein